MLEIGEKLYKFSTKHGHKCYWCGGMVNLSMGSESPLAATREHLVPKSMKEHSVTADLVLAHRMCNERRATMDAIGFKKLMDGLSVTKYDLWPSEALHKNP